MTKLRRINTPVLSPAIAGPMHSAFKEQSEGLLQEGIRFFSQIPEFMSEHTKMVAVNGFWVAGQNEYLSRIGASSMESSVAIAIHDPVKGVAGVVHAISVDRNSSPDEENTLERLLPVMFEFAAKSGASVFNVTTFNIAHGIRPPELTAMMKGALARALAEARKAFKIIKFTQRDEHNFILYSKDGSFYVAEAAEK